MKRSATLLLAVAICTASLVACKKDHTCKCTATVSIPGFGSFSADSTIALGKTTKKKAKTSCSDKEADIKKEIQNDPDSLGGTVTVSCKVD